MTCVAYKAFGTYGVVCIGGPTYQIRVGGKVYPFEWHSYFGPAALDKRTGDPLLNQPPAFLKAASLWNKQGRRVDGDGLCVWKYESWLEELGYDPAKWRIEHLGGRQYRIVPIEPQEPSP